MSRFDFKKKFFIFSLILNFVLPAIQIFSEDFFWKTSDDGKVRIWTNDSRNFLWKGLEKEGVADGIGIIQFTDKRLSFEGAKFFYGAKESDFVELNGSGDRYVGEGRGEGEKKVPEGRGVLIKKNGNIYIGDFKKGKVDGKASRFVADKDGKKGQLVYRGSFKSNLFEGHGNLYDKGKLCYSGTFRKGIKSGSGTEYHNGFSVFGEFADGQKEGLFEIDGYGINREVYFHNDVPDLSNVKISYSGEIVFEGSADTKFNPKGEGKILYKNGDVYQGEIEENKRNGFGVFSSGKDEKRFYYEGGWENDRCSGFGEAEFVEGWYYSGNWLDNAFEGHGTLTAENFRYSGNWKGGKKNGFGTLLIGESRFDGEFKDDRLHGEGVMNYANGDVYDGEWSFSCHEGYGEYYWADGSCYLGEWEDNLQNGDGIFVFPSGERYEGSFLDGNFSGKGIFVFSENERYEGYFKENRKNGQGKYSFSDGSIYEGEFKNDKIDGQGKYSFPDGSFYTGAFFDGKPHGKGSLSIPDENGFTVFISTVWNGNQIPESGTMLFSNGDEFVGKFDKGIPTEDGVWRRNGKKTVAEEAYRFYKNHEETIKNVVSKTQLVLAGISVAGDVVAVVAAAPCPPAAGAALVVSKVADIANASISGLNIAVGTGVMLRETSDARILGDFEEEKNIRNEYFKEQAWNVADIVMTFGSGAFKIGKAAAKGSVNAAKISEKSASASKKILTKYKNFNLRKIDMRLSSMKRSGKIKLSAADVDWILKEPKVNLRAMVKSKTGVKTFGEGFQEFFVRLSEGDKEQVKLLMENPEIRKTVNHAIRGGGGKHEWLMTKNFTDFLTNGKWGKDGQKAAIALTELVQDTKSVAFKNGGTHFDKMNSGKFHEGLSKTIESSDSIESLLSNVNNYAESALTKESFKEFSEIFNRCFR